MTTPKQPMPGSDLVGRGILLMPHRPYQLRKFLFPQDKCKTYYAIDANKEYLLPEGYEVNESPPMPANKALNQVMIEESFERFDKSTALDANLAAGNGVFSISANLSKSNQVRSDQEAYYALRSSFIPLWNIYLPSTENGLQKEMEADIPTPFTADKRRAFDAFFAKYGSHFVRRVWVGGKADLTFTIVKSANMSKEDIQAGIAASYGLAGGAEANMKAQESKEKLQANSSCLVTGKGGDELKLASLSKLDETLYNEWLTSIDDNPQVIELELEGLWNLIEDEEKAKALQAAYNAATNFSRISSMMQVGNEIMFIRRNKYSAYDFKQGISKPEQEINALWPELAAQAKIMEIDAVLDCADLRSPDGEDLTGKFYFFDEGRCALMDMRTKAVDPRYTLPLEQAWPGLDKLPPQITPPGSPPSPTVFTRIDAALNAGPNSIYLFMGSWYVRYNYAEQRVDEGYPQLISRRWAGVTFDRIDVATYRGNGKVYFFRSDQIIRYDMTMYRTDPGYPKSIIGNYLEDINFFY